MKTTFILILCCLSLFVCPAQSKYEVINARDEYLKVDKDLNKTYQKILLEYKSDTLFIINLKKAQRIWIQFRDAELAMKYPNDVKDNYKDLPPICISTYLTKLTFERIRTLSAWTYRNREEDDCIGSIRNLSKYSFDIPHIMYSFEPESARWIIPPDGLNINSPEMVEDQDIQNGKIAVVRYDLNADGTSEYFIKTLCGNGGCDFYIYDGKTFRSLGDIFGSPIWICEGKHFGARSILTYSHQSADSGNWTIYEFNGKEYQVTQSTLLKGNEVVSFFDAINISIQNK